MNILIVNEFGNYKIKNVNFLPRKGDRIALFCRPYPIVTDVLFWPSDEILQGLNVIGHEIEAIVTVN